MLAAAVVLCGAVWMAYGSALHLPFVFDDRVSVLHNSSILKLWPLLGDSQHPGPLNPPTELPTSGRPLVNLSLALNDHFGALNPVGYHAFNLIVHLLSALLLMAIVRRSLRLEHFGGRFDDAAEWLALATAFLWAVHPLGSETVVYVTQRTELMVGFFYLATLYASLRYWAASAQARRTAWGALATLSCLAGMASKEVMVTAPVVVLLFERTFVAGSFRRALRNSWPLYIGLFLSWGLLLYLNCNAPRSTSAGFHLGLPAYAWWFTQAKVLMLYLKLTVWPWPLAIHYEIPYLTTFGAAWPWLLSSGLLAIATLVLLRRRNAVGFAGAWVLLILSPTLVVPIITEVAAERRMYLPLAALVSLWVIGGYWLARQVALRRSHADANRDTQWPLATVTLTALLLFVVMGLVSARRLAAYQDEITLWRDNLISQPDDPVAHNNLGNLFPDQPQEAIKQFEHAARLKPDYPEAYYNIGVVLGETGRLPQAIEQYRQALRVKPDYPQAHCNLGDLLIKTGQPKEAIVHLEEAVRLKPDFPQAHNCLGIALKQLDQLPAAIEQYQEALRIDPDFADASYNLGNALAGSGHAEAAIQHYQHALAIKPDFAEAHYNLANVLLEERRTEEAVEHLQQFVRLKPDDAAGYAKLTKLLAALQRSEEAIATAHQALELARSSGQTALAAQIESWLSAYRAEVTRDPSHIANPSRAPTSGSTEVAP